ncbi:MAG: membrane protein insertase YidC [Ignavibacteriaceae bacterium]|nr:membrane protein insertase YidC [Ignavibacteriaceae bacterium]
MDKQTTIAFVFIGAILVLWLYLNSPKQPEQTTGKTDTSSVSYDTNKNKPAVESKKEETKNAVAEPVSGKSDSSSYGKYFSAPSGNEQIITVENELVKLELSNRGGDIKKYFLKNYNNWFTKKADAEKNFYNSHVQLVDYPQGGGGPDLSFVSTDGKAINTSKLEFVSNASKSYYNISGKDSLVIVYTLKVADNKYLEKTFIFYGAKYSMKCSLNLVGLNNIIGNNDIDFVWSKGLRGVEENSVDETSYSNASVYYGGDHVVVDPPKVGEKAEKDFNGTVDWVAVRNKYFAAIIAPQNPSGVDGAYVEGYKSNIANNGLNTSYNIRLIIPFNNSELEQKSFNIYIGPADYTILKSYGHNLDEIVEFGNFLGLKFLIRFISLYLLLPLFNMLHLLIPNYGVVIIVFSLIIKILLYPLTKSSFQSMKKMQLLQPKMTELKEKYKDDPQKMNKETMKLYSTYGVNPAGGCLPLLLQMPIFIALWGLLKVAIELRQQPFVFWITDLSRPDNIFTLPFKLPFFGIDQVSGLALLMGITTFVQQKMSVKDPKQQSLVYIMPVFLTILFMSFPAGLNLYYFMFNVFSIAQQYYINQKHDGMELVPVKNPKKTGGFMSRMMDAAEKNAKVQQQKRKR